MQDFGTPSGKISNELERKRKEERKREKMPFIVSPYVSASSQGQRTHSARTNDLLKNVGEFEGETQSLKEQLANKILVFFNQGNLLALKR